MSDQELFCDRCGVDVSQRLKNKLHPHIFTNEIGEPVKLMLCWDCDWDVINGGDPFRDPADIWADRWEDAYAYDPVNTPPPLRRE